jgi:hypothetical protein
MDDIIEDIGVLSMRLRWIAKPGRVASRRNIKLYYINSILREINGNTCN